MAVSVPAARPGVPLLRHLIARGSLLRRLLARPPGLVSVTVVVAILVVAALAPVIAPHHPDTIDVLHRFQGPSLAHLVGTDYLGRDSLSRVIFGARTALEVAVPAVVAGFLAGLAIGLASGYLGGLIDKVVIVFVDTLLSFPAVILGLALLTLLGPSVRNTILLIAIALVPGYGRLARAQTLALKQQPYVKAERSLGAGRARIILVHVLPNMIAPLLVLVAMDFASAIGIEAGFSFLGLGIQPPTPDWGVMLNDGFTDVRTAPWPLVAPLVALVVVTAAFTMLGETLRDLTDPKATTLRRGRIRGVRRI